MTDDLSHDTSDRSAYHAVRTDMINLFKRIGKTPDVWIAGLEYSHRPSARKVIKRHTVTLTLGPTGWLGQRDFHYVPDPPDQWNRTEAGWIYPTPSGEMSTPVDTLSKAVCAWIDKKQRDAVEERRQIEDNYSHVRKKESTLANIADDLSNDI